jgi:hypothetical protein
MLFKVERDLPGAFLCAFVLLVIWSSLLIQCNVDCGHPFAMNASGAIGLRVRTGHAVVVVLKGTRRAPEIVLRHEIELADPWVPESLHPYHEELGERSPATEQARQRGCDAARTASGRAIRTLVDDMKSHGLEPCGAAIVASSVIDPARIGGAHPRAHAEEGTLYREAVEAALADCELAAVTFIEKSLRAVAARRLGQTERQLDATLKKFSHEVGTPWRAPEKQAALAAWIVLGR